MQSWGGRSSGPPEQGILLLLSHLAGSTHPIPEGALRAHKAVLACLVLFQSCPKISPLPAGDQCEERLQVPAW